MQGKRFERTVLFLALLACVLVFAVLLHLSVFPFIVFAICAGFFLLCRENELLGFLAIVFLLPFNIQLQQFIGTPFASVQDFLVLVLAMEFFSRRILEKKTPEKGDLLLPLSILFVLYLLSASIAVQHTVFPDKIPQKIQLFFHSQFMLVRQLISAGEWLLFFFLSFNIVKTRQDAKKALALMLFSLLLVSILAVLQFNIGARQNRGPDFSGLSLETFLGINPADQWRVASLLSGVNQLGWYVALLLPITIAFFLTESKKTKKISFAFVFAFALLALYYSGSRGAWIGALAEFSLALGIFVGLFVFKKKSGLYRAAIFAIIVFCILAVAFSEFLKETNAIGRGNVLEKEISVQQRALLLQLGATIIAQNPLFGIGPGLFAYSFLDFFPRKPEFWFLHAHNLFVETAVEAGLVALAVFLFILAKTFVSLYNKSKGEDKEKALFSAALALGFAGFLVAGLFDYVFFDLGITLLFWALVAISFRL